MLRGNLPRGKKNTTHTHTQTKKLTKLEPISEFFEGRPPTSSQVPRRQKGERSADLSPDMAGDHVPVCPRIVRCPVMKMVPCWDTIVVLRPRGPTTGPSTIAGWFHICVLVCMCRFVPTERRPTAAHAVKAVVRTDLLPEQTNDEACRCADACVRVHPSNHAELEGFSPYRRFRLPIEGWCGQPTQPGRPNGDNLL